VTGGSAVTGLNLKLTHQHLLRKKWFDLRLFGWNLRYRQLLKSITFLLIKNIGLGEIGFAKRFSHRDWKIYL